MYQIWCMLQFSETHIYARTEAGSVEIIITAHCMSCKPSGQLLKNKQVEEAELS